MDKINKTMERKQLAQLAAQYRQQGYEVMFPPDYEELPDFISTYTPDLVVRNEQETVVIQIQTSNSPNFTNTQYLSHLAKEIEKYPNWKLALKEIKSDSIKITNSLIAQDSLQANEIREKLQIVKQLAREYPEAATLLCWSLIEATIRLLVKKEHLSLKEFDFKRLIKELVFNGIISQSQYSTLQKANQLRNTIAHGFKTDIVDNNHIEQIMLLQQELLTELEHE